MANWPTVPIGQIGEIFDGPHATPKTVEAGPIFLGIGALNQGRLNLAETRHVTPEDFITWTRRVKPRAGDVVFSYETRLGEVAIIPEGLECCLGRRMGLIRVDRSRYDPRFLLYYYLSPQFQKYLKSRTIDGATVDRLALKEFPSFPVPDVSLSLQTAIASVLTALDEKIELNKRTSETLEAMAQALFRDWFVDFGPVRRKMEGAIDPATILGGLLSPGHRATEIAALFPGWLGDDGLPDGWTIEEVGNLTDAVGGATPSTTTAEYWGGEHVWVTPKDLSNLNGIYVGESERQISELGLLKIGSGLSPAGSVLLSSRAPIGYVAIAAVPVAVNQGFIVLRPTARFPTSFAYFWVKQNIDVIKSHANGSTFQEISKKNFRPLPAIFPGNQILEAFAFFASPLLDLIRQRESESALLAETRDYVLPKLISGEVVVDDVTKASV